MIDVLWVFAVAFVAYTVWREFAWGCSIQRHREELEKRLASLSQEEKCRG